MEVVATLWLSLLRMTVIPLMVSRLIVGIGSARSSRTVGQLGAGSSVVFVALLLAAGAFAVLTTPFLLAGVDMELAELEGAPGPSLLGETAPPPTDDSDGGNWLATLVPSNPIQAAVDGEILALVFFSVVFAIAVGGIRPDRRQLILHLFEGLAEAITVILGWVLVFIPIGIFALTFSVTIRIGPQVAGALAYFIVLLSGVLLAFNLLLYPIASLLGACPPGRFARALVPAQAVAVSTRSSIAALPMLIHGARSRLRLPESVVGFVLPLASSTFKVHRTISDPVELLFLAKIYGIDLGAAQIITVMALALVLSFAAVGIPSGGMTFTTLPAFLAVGIPLEGVVLLATVDAIPDIFKTLVNVTGDMTAATLLARFSRA